MARGNVPKTEPRARILAHLAEIAKIVRSGSALPLGYPDTADILEYVLDPEQMDTRGIPALLPIKKPRAKAEPLTETPRSTDLRFIPKDELLAETLQAHLMLALEEFKLSRHAHRALEQKGLRVVGTLFAYGLERLIELPGFGLKGYKDLINELAARDIFVLSASGQPITSLLANLPGDPEDWFTDEELMRLKNAVPQYALELPIERLQLKTRSYNALKENEIDTLGDVIGALQKDLMLSDIRNLGVKSALDIHRNLKDFLPLFKE